MKPLDSKGEYTRTEVKAALSGENGNLPFSYRYELLNEENDYLEDIDYVQSCSIENNSLADIKRTAKFDILDTGTINYLKHRIKPYVRINMPVDANYTNAVVALSPSVWWKMDDPNVTPAATGTTAIANGLTYNTAETANLVDLTVNSGRTANIVTGSGTLRSEYWAYVTTTVAQALQIQLKNTGTQTIVYETYQSTDLVSPRTLVRTDTVPTGRDFTFGFAVPAPGVYFVRAIAQTATTANVNITFSRSARLEDSSGNQIYGLGSGLTLKSTPALPDGGTSWMTNNSFRSVVADTIEIPVEGGLSINFWESHTLDGNEFSSQWGTQTGYFQYYISDDVTSGTYVAKMEFHPYAGVSRPSWTGALTLPATMYKAGNNMVTVTVDPAKNVVKMFINGKYAGTITDASSATIDSLGDLFDSEYFSYGYVGNYSFGPMYFDDYLLFAKALAPAEVSDLYQKGKVASSTRSGYVEWPQGVFVLSSPTRTMEDGHYVHRDVEGYDQLVILKEDSFDYRYSALANTYYTDAVKKVLQSASAVKKYTLANPVWSTADGAAILSDTSILFNGTSTNNPRVTTSVDAFAFGGLIVSGKFTNPTTNSKMSLEVKLGPDTYSIATTTTGTITANAFNSTVWSATYSSTTHAYWRIREVGGTIKFGYSSNGTTWTEPATSTPTLTTEAPVTVNTNLLAFVTPAGDKVDYLSVTAAPLMANSIVKSTKKLTTTMEWEVGTSKLQIINELLAAINYTSATYDENGTFISKPYVSPDKRSAEFSYKTDEQSVILGNVDQTIDLFKIPNKWVCVVSDPDRPPLVGTYTNTNPLSPTSTVSRGRTIVQYVDEQNAPDQVTLDAQAARLAFEASQVYESIEFETSMMPIHQDADVYTVTIDGLSVNAKYAEHTWSMELSNGSTMKHRVRKVVGL